MKFKASFYMIPCYFEEKNNKLYGRNNFYDFLLNSIAIPTHLILIFLCSWVFNFELLFPIKLYEEIE